MSLMEKFDNFMSYFLGYRKFTIMLLVLTASVILLIKHFLDGSQWTSLMTVVVPAYMGSNAIEHATNAVQTYFSGQNVTNTTTTNSTTTVTPVPEPSAPQAAGVLARGSASEASHLS